MEVVPKIVLSIAQSANMNIEEGVDKTILLLHPFLVCCLIPLLKETFPMQNSCSLDLGTNRNV